MTLKFEYINTHTLLASHSYENYFVLKHECKAKYVQSTDTEVKFISLCFLNVIPGRNRLHIISHWITLLASRNKTRGYITIQNVCKHVELQ